MTKTHLPRTFIRSSNLRKGIKKWEIVARCNSSYISPEVSMDPRKVNCKNCIDSYSLLKKVHFRPSKHWYKSNKLPWLAVNNPKKVTCYICLGFIKLAKNGHLPDPTTDIIINISTDNRE